MMISEGDIDCGNDGRDNGKDEVMKIVLMVMVAMLPLVMLIHLRHHLIYSNLPPNCLYSVDN